MERKKLISKIGRVYPRTGTIVKDYNGFVSGLIIPSHISRILLALDLDLEVLAVAEEKDVQLIITHHPFLYGKKTAVLKSPLKKAIYERLLKKKIGVYCMHTNFDYNEMGMNYQLLKQLGINGKRYKDNSFVFIGDFEEAIHIQELSKMICEKWHVPYILIASNHNDALIKRVALVAGSGGREYLTALEAQADVFISGEFPHHVRRDCCFLNLPLFEVAHEVEKIFMPVLAKLISEIDSSIEVFTCDNQQYPVVSF